jgi:hypothetical protein
LIDESQLDAKVGQLLEVLYQKRFASLDGLTLTKLINKNPYLYRALGIEDASEFIEQLLAARISSSDETIFGNDFLEPLAIWSAQASDQHDGGARSVTVGAGAGQDIAIETATAYLAISVKSGKNIFNSQSNKGQSTEFVAMQSRLKKINKQFRAIVGYGYGRKLNRTVSTTEKLAGQVFWELLTGESDYYLRIAGAIGKYSASHGEAYKKAYAIKKQQLLRAFMVNFVSPEGEMLWDAVVAFNSSKARPKRLISPPAEVPVDSDAQSA